MEIPPLILLFKSSLHYAILFVGERYWSNIELLLLSHSARVKF